MVLERLRGQAEEHSAVSSALEAAMQECLEGQREAANCLGFPAGRSNANGAGTIVAAADGKGGSQEVEGLCGGG